MYLYGDLDYRYYYGTDVVSCSRTAKWLAGSITWGLLLVTTSGAVVPDILNTHIIINTPKW